MWLRLLTLLMGLLIGLLAGPVAAADTGLGRLHAFKDWVVGCDNTRRCEAQGYGSQTDDAPPGGRAALIVRREAGPGQAPVVDLLFSHFDEQVALPAPGQVLTVQAGALRLRLPPLTKDASGPIVPAAQAPALLAAALKAQHILVSAGKQQWSVSLAGASAALLKMDDLQGRVGTTSALVRRGPATAPAALPLPEVVSARLPPTTEADRRLEPRLRDALGAALRREGLECPGVDPAQPLEGPIRVTAGSLLVLQPCWRGAYQTGSRVWLVDDRPPFQARALMLPQPDGSEGDSLVAELIESGGGVLTLHESAKGRGIGDCWATREWTWTARGLALVAATESPCQLFEAGGLGIDLWRSR